MIDVDQEVEAAEPLARLTVRIPFEAAERLRQAAFAARLKPAQVVRVILLKALASNTVAKLAPPAPPAMDELLSTHPSAAQLLQTIYGIVSNCTQLQGHAARAPDPVNRLAQPGGILERLAADARSMGLVIKAGEMDEQRAAQLLTLIGGARAEAINAFAKHLNEGGAAANDDWITVLQPLLAAFKTDAAASS